MRWMGALALVVVLTGVPARADDAGRLKIAHDIVETSHAADNVRQLMPVILQQMRPVLTRNGTDAKIVDAFLQQAEQRFDQQVDRFVELSAQIYAREFSEEDLDNLLAFYRTPTGQRMLAKQTEIAQAMIQVGQQWGQMIAQEVLADFQKQKQQGTLPKL